MGNCLIREDGIFNEGVACLLRSGYSNDDMVRYLHIRDKIAF